MSEQRNKKMLILVAVWIVVIAVIGGGVKYFFFPHQQAKLESLTSSGTSYSRGQLTLAADSFSGYAVIRSDDFRNRLKSLGLKLVVEDDKADYLARIKALKSGKIDMAVFTVDSLVSAAAEINEIPGTIILVIDESKGADAIVANEKVMSQLQDLDNPTSKLVLTPASPSEFFARVTMAHFNLTNLEQRWESANGSTDVLRVLRSTDPSAQKAYVLWEPELSLALQIPGMKVIADSSKLNGYIMDVLVVRREYLRDHEDIVQEIMKSYFQSVYFYNKEVDGMKKLVIQDAKDNGGQILNDQQATRLVTGIQWKNTLENYAHFDLLSGQEAKGLRSLEDIITDVTKVLVQTGSLNNNIISGKETTLFYNKILADLQTANFHPGQDSNLMMEQAGLNNLKTADFSEVRGVAELPALSEEDWQKLITVGQMRIKPISFGRGKANISIQGQRDLDELAYNLESWPMYYLMVVGRASAVGDMEANIALAERRAQAVGEYLTSGGVSPNRVKIIATKPMGDSPTAQAVTFSLGQLPF
jgi:outer membrane protein OmpA-like peptidoglycan-associated protein/ABC-type nitrate/sulfonate/bicarbonate transport system substrate-binding protein